MSRKVIRAPYPRRRRNFELAIADLQHALAHPEMDERPSVICHATLHLYPFIEELAGNPEKTQVLIDLTLSAREATDNRSDCTGALNVLGANGVIDERQALSRLDKWKERHPWA